MTLLRQRMLEELQRRNYSQATIESYIFSVKECASYFRKPPGIFAMENVDHRGRYASAALSID